MALVSPSHTPFRSPLDQNQSQGRRSITCLAAMPLNQTLRVHLAKVKTKNPLIGGFDTRGVLSIWINFVVLNQALQSQGSQMSMQGYFDVLNQTPARTLL